MLTSKQQTRNEAPKMRRVRNQNARSGNPGLMFAAGVEKIISDHMSHRTRQVQLELVESKPVTTKPVSRENLFGALLRQFSY